MKRQMLIRIVAVMAGVALCTGCGSEITKYIDEETARDITSLGKSFIEDKGDDIAALGKSYVSEKSDELISDAIQSSSEMISSFVKEMKKESGELQNDNAAGNGSEVLGTSRSKGVLTSTEDINLRDVDGKGKSYVFTYNGEDYSVEHWKEHWKIINSYKINDSNDMMIICQALIDVNPLHGADIESYRTAEDMAYEWVQHNIAYEFLPKDNEWRQKSKDVDFNPEDQGKSFVEIYEERTGKEFKLSEFFH